MSSGAPLLSPAQAIIAAMITPALLILASGSLIATALARLARVVDRIRRLAELEGNHHLAAIELNRYELRAGLAQRSIAALFAAVALFVVAGVAIALDRATGERLEWLPITLVLVGMSLIVVASAAMVSESRLSARQLGDEIAALRAR